MVRIGYDLQFAAVMALSLKGTSSCRAMLSPIMAPPSTCRFNCSGLTTIPGSRTTVYLPNLTTPVVGTIVTSQAQAQKVPDRNMADMPWPRTAFDPVETALGFGVRRLSQPDSAF